MSVIILGWIGIVLPLVFAALLVLLVLRAATRQSRYRVVRSFGEEDRRAVREAVAAAERRMVGEILPVVVERSDPHPAAEWLAALSLVLVGSAALVGLTLFAPRGLMGLVRARVAQWLP